MDGRGADHAAARSRSASCSSRAGSRRLSSQTLLDVRLSTAITLGKLGRIDLLLDVLNLLNDTAEESLATETLMTETVFSPTFGQPVSFVDPRRAMIGVRLNLGR